MDEDSVEILKRRYAKGEITKKQYEKMRRELREGEEGVNEKTLGQGRSAGGAIPAKPKRTHPFIRAFVILIFGGVVFLLMLWNEYPNLCQPGTFGCGSTTSVIATTTIPMQHFDVLFSKGQNFSVGPATNYYGRYANFSIPQNATGINITGSYASQGYVEVALLNDAQHTTFQANHNSIIYNNTYYYGNTQGATIDTINAGLAPGEYYFEFYDPGAAGADNITIIDPIMVTYTLTNQTSTATSTATTTVGGSTTAKTIATTTASVVTVSNPPIDSRTGCPPEGTMGVNYECSQWYTLGSCSVQSCTCYFVYSGSDTIAAYYHTSDGVYFRCSGMGQTLSCYSAATALANYCTPSST